MSSIWSSTKKLRGRFFRRKGSSSSHHGRQDDDTTSVPFVQVICNTTTAAAHPNTAIQISQDRLPMLYAVSKTWAWPAVEFRSRTHPDEASFQYTDEKGDTCLHWVCFGNPPLTTVAALLSACPELAATRNRQGTLPLHVACSYRASSGVIRALVRAYPDGAASRNRSKSFPLHILCDFGSSLDALRAILCTAQGLSTLKAVDGVYRRTSLEILNARKNMANFHRDIKVLRRSRAREIIHGHETCSNVSEHAPLKSMDFWRKASLLVWLEYNKEHNKNAVREYLEQEENDDSDESRMEESFIVHACVGLRKCPLSLLTFAMLLYPHQLLQPDEENGQLPLHIAARQPDTARLLDVLSSSPRRAASVFDKDGNLPIMIAIASGTKWNEGVGALLAAFSPALESMSCVQDALYPYIWSKLMQLPHYNGAASIYESLRAKPSIVKSAIA